MPKKPSYEELEQRVAELEYQLRTTEENSRKSDDRYRLVTERTSDLIAITTFSSEPRYVYVSPSNEATLGYKSEHMVGKCPFDFIHPEDSERLIPLLNSYITAKANKTLTRNDKAPVEKFIYRLRDFWGNWRYLETTGDLLDDEHILFISRDITARKALEAELQHARRMEALGTLAGGVAHDFNNLLMGIQGRISMMLMDLDASHPHYQDLKDAEEIIKSGAGLTRQLLGFSRGGKCEVRATDLNSLIKQTLELFGRTRKQVKILRKCQRDLWGAEVDRGQIEQVFLNLFLNASEAMPNGGTLSVRTKNTTLDNEFTELHGVPAGRFVHISVADTGVGMDEDTLRRIFEPFFTTKGMGRGTGLGLASSYGTIKNHGGIIKASSRLGAGTTFDIYLPASEGAVTRDPASSPEPVLRGTETVFLVDDEPKVLDVCERFLRALGYSVLTAKNGWEALQTYERSKANIDIAVLDMIMPGMNGGELFDRLRAMEPSLRALVSTGYSVEGEVSDLIGRGCRGYIQKPFSIRALAKEIRRVLDEKSLP